VASGTLLEQVAVAWNDPHVVLHLVRHACAGQKGEWIGPDDERPLDPAGVSQARALVAALDGEPVGALLASPSRRCVQTLEPLADALGRDVGRTTRLLPDVSPEDLLAFLVAPDLDRAVLCTHGEAMRELLPLVRAGGAMVEPAGLADEDLLTKGTAWRLEVDPARCAVVRLRHLRPSPDAECHTHRERSSSST
jgi:phosphohistidine phosphatase SixA